MKKITIILVAILSIFSVAISTTGCGKKKDDNVIRVSEVTHSLFYAPFYVAITNGYFEEYDIEIELTNAGGSDTVMSSLISKSADVGLLGPESIVYVNNNGMENAPVIFAQLTSCDGSFLMGRTDEGENFDWNNLVGTHIIAGRKAGMPAMTLQYILNQRGLTTGDEFGDGVDVKLDTSVAFNLTTPTFIEGTGDYCTMFEPTASQCVENNQAYIVAALGDAVSDIPYTCFTSTSKFLKNNSKKVENFIKALVKGYNFVMTATDEQLLEALRPQFSTTSDSLIISAVRNYIAIGAYASSPVLSQTAWNNMLEIIDNAGELKGNVSHSTAVNTALAQKVLAS